MATQYDNREKTMIQRFQGSEGERRLIASLAEHRLVANNFDLAKELVAVGTLIEVPAGEIFIKQGDQTAEVFFIVSGKVEVTVNNKRVAIRASGDIVGEMAALEPSQPRAASVRASDTSVMLKVSEESFSAIADKFSDIWRRLAATLARRLAERNHLVTAQRERIRVFIISSAEAIPVVDLLIRQFEHDPFLAVAWKNGVFRASNYTLDEMDDELERSDFAIAVAHSDDVVITRSDEWPTVRDNVVFELGMFMGRLGRRRAFLMEPRDVDLKLPSDLAGLTTIPYRYEKGRDAEHLIAPACARLRELILAAGPKE
ncbi:CRP/FNR family cyclic AMP-dependent transcriptional regulator [Luteibacter sp. HA06]